MAKRKKKKRKGGPPKGVTPPHLKKFAFKKGGKRRGGKVAKKKKGGGGRKKQGVVSWLRAVIALFIALFHPLQLLFAGDVETFTYEASAGMSAGAFDKGAALTMYGPMAGALLFHAITGELSKRMHIRSLIPALTA